MRPDRIILGEVRGSEAFDMLQAMNTGHAGSMSTIHANSPRDALARLEDMVTLTGFQLSSLNIQNKIASAIDLIVQIERQYDGSRNITQITEVVGMRENVITLQDIFLYVQTGEDASGHIQGALTFCGFRPYLMARAVKYNLGEEFDKLLF
jgi:pilus assembly protein CpaF